MLQGLVYAQTQQKTAKINKQFSEVFDLSDNEGTAKLQTTLPASFIEAVRTGKVDAYSDSGMTSKLSLTEVDEIVKARHVIDTIPSFDPETNYKLERVVESDFDFNQVHCYKLLASGHRAVPDGRDEIRVLGIAPLRKRPTRAPEKGEFQLPTPAYQTLFWLHYDDVKELLDNYDKGHAANNFASRLKNLKVPEADVLDYSDGTKYIGHIKDGVPEGKGVKYWQDGDIYEGEWKDGKRNGKGILYHAAGARYDGEWKDDMAHGQGTLYYVDGGKYTGGWKYDLRDGDGTLNSGNGDKYVGHFEHGRQNGKGIATSKNGNKFEGIWKEDEMDEGTLTLPNGYRYIGHFEQGKPGGKGKGYFSNGDIYEGEWKDNKMDGYGTLRIGEKLWSTADIGGCPRCKIYKGNWKDGQKSGKGTCYDKNLEIIYEGRFEYDYPAYPVYPIR